ncbi:MAG: hypothetical protein RR623_06770 [Bacilli bacterium]
MKVFSRGILWNQRSEWDLWIDRIQKRRNTIHAFNNREIGNTEEFMNNLTIFFDFIDYINKRFTYPEGLSFKNNDDTILIRN